MASLTSTVSDAKHRKVQIFINKAEICYLSKALAGNPIGSGEGRLQVLGTS